MRKRVRRWLVIGFMIVGASVAFALSPIAGEFFGYTEFFLEPTPYPEMAKMLDEAPFWFRVERLYYRCEKAGSRLQDFLPLENIAAAAQRCGSIEKVYVAALEATGVRSAQSFARRHQPPFDFSTGESVSSCTYYYYPINCHNYLYQ